MADYHASSVGISASAATNQVTNKDKSKTQAYGFTPPVVLPSYISGSDSGTTQSAIAAGGITVRNGDKQTQDVGSLSRDTDNANHHIDKIFDPQKMAQQQELQTAFGQVANQAVGDLGSAMGWSEGGPEKTAIHAVIGAIQGALGGGSALAGGLSGMSSEAVASAVEQYLGDHTNLTSTERGAITQWAALITGGAIGGMVGGKNGASSGANASYSSVSYNYLSHAQKAKKEKELSECKDMLCKSSVEARWAAVDVTQDASFAAGMVAGVPAGLYDSVDGIVKTASNPLETYEALKSLFNSGDVLGNVSDAVRQSYVDRINQMEAEYQKAGASGSFNAGVEGGKVVTDIAGLLAGGAGIVKGGALLTEKVAAKVISKAENAAVNAGNAAHNAASYAALKLDLKTTEAANEVVESLRNTGQLPPNYLDKSQAKTNGWKPGKALDNTSPGKQLGGDIFENSNNLLPSQPGRVWREADVGLDNTMSRSNQAGTRLLYSDDGLLYITTDHYETATSIGQWK